MAKSSQLAQLKAALGNAGVSRQSQPTHGRKRKRESVGEGKDVQRKEAKLDRIMKDLNPFDVKVTKLKHDVGGRKLKGVTGRPGLSKQVGIELRRKTLLPEYDLRNKSGSFIDRRFGEDDPTLAPEEKMLERFTRERQRASKGAAFNLDDEAELTHYGQSLSAMDDFDAAGITLSDNEEEEEEDSKGQIDSNVVEAGHFGGFEEAGEEEDGPPRKKSKAEVMAEVIAKSKEHKHLRQVEKERDEQLRQALDEEFGEIRELLFANPYTTAGGEPDDSAPIGASTGSNRIPIGRRNAIPLVASQEEHPAEVQQEMNDDDYDQFVRELAFDRRSKPTNRLKTEEEVALEGREKLEAAEKARLRRMRGEEASDDSGDERSGGRRRRTAGQADDLEDDFEVDEDSTYRLGPGLSVGGVAGPGMEEESGDEETTDDEEEGVTDEEDVSEEEGDSEASDLGDDLMPEDLGIESGDLDSTEHSAKMKGFDTPVKLKKAYELPYVFPCPDSHEEFLDILDGVEDEDVATVVQRIRVRYHPSLGVDYKEKLQGFLGVLVDHILYVTAPPRPSYALGSALFPHLKALASSYPIPAAEAFVSKLAIMQKNLARGLAKGAILVDAKTWPGPAELAFLRIIGLLWSTSDFTHPVVTPAFLLMGQYLAQARVRSLADVTSGLFLCTLCVQYTGLSKRLVPEATNFLNNALLYLTPHGIDVNSVPGSFPSPDLATDAVRALRLTKKDVAKMSPRPPNILDILGGTSVGVQTTVDIIGLSFDLVLRTAQNLTSLDGFTELFEPTRNILELLSHDKFSPALKDKHSACLSGLSRMLKFARQSRKPLFLQAHKPIPIATYLPKFDEGHKFGRQRDANSERNAAQKLRTQYKQERRGAMRELRKDNRFLAAEQAKRQEEKDLSYKAKMARLEGEISVERHEEKQMEREKMKQRRRAGKK